jgi:predicted ATPase
MVYLKSFNLPKDTWVDYYFTPPKHPEDIPKDIPDIYFQLDFDSRTIHQSWYPWKTFYNRYFTHIDFGDITIFYGGNASGKTTLLNVIAEKLGLQRTSLFNTSDFFTQYCEGNGGFELSDNHKSPKAIGRGKIIVSDDVFKRIHQVRDYNQQKVEEIENVSNEYWAMEHVPKSLTVSKFIKRTIDYRRRTEMSNGETGFQYFIENIPDEALVLLDEPENSLSAEWQMSLAHELYIMATRRDCQLVIASHSPFILSMPGAKIYNLDSTPVQTAKWYELDNMRAYYNLFNMHRKSFETAK